MLLYFPQMLNVSRTPTVICQMSSLSINVSYTLFPLLFLASIFLHATYYLEISLLLMSFYSTSARNNLFLHSLIICLLLFLISTPSFSLHFPKPPISVCVQSLFVSFPDPLSLSLLLYPTQLSVTAGHLVHLSLFSHPFTSISFPFPTVNQAGIADSPCCVSAFEESKKKGALAGIQKISVFCQERRYTPEALISKTEATQS